ncbi:TetR/AcrR family transcriptional regulator [Celeribacter halophilus]|uniref:TetR/AcrR family transcriptional regulator n=1 Tax=Celeribacter halophilus TaxID=576117 RepID=UPI003A9400F4
MTKKVSGGRPTDERASAALKAAALQLVRENGYEKVSIAAIAKEAGVARQTLYNRWNTKADLVLEAVFEETGNYAAQPALEEDKSCRVVLEEFLINVFEHLNKDRDTLCSIVAAAQKDVTFNASFHKNFVLPREKMITALLHRAQDRGELSRGRNPEMISTMIHGAFWYRLLNRGALDARLATDITTEVFERPPASP